MNRNQYVGTIAALLLAASQSPLVAAESSSPAARPALVGADRDTHGCIGSAGYTWCAAEARCERPWELAARKALPNTPEAFATYCNATPELSALAALLSGTFDNASQAQADVRQRKPVADQHVPIRTEISRVTAPAFGEYVWLWINRSQTAQGPQLSYRLATLEPGAARGQVVMRHYLKMEGAISLDELASLQPAALRRTEGCDYVFTKTATGFRGRQLTKACRFKWGPDDVYTDNTISLTAAALEFVDHKFIVATDRRITGVTSGTPFKLRREHARR